MKGSVPHDKDLLQALVRGGSTLRDIAIMFEATPSGVAYVLDVLGVPRRRRDGTMTEPARSLADRQAAMRGRKAIVNQPRRHEMNPFTYDPKEPPRAATPSEQEVRQHQAMKALAIAQPTNEPCAEPGCAYRAVLDNRCRNHYMDRHFRQQSLTGSSVLLAMVMEG